MVRRGRFRVTIYPVMVCSAFSMAVNGNLIQSVLVGRFEGSTASEQGVEIAAAEGHRHCQEQRDEEPEWTTNVQHT